MKIVVIGGSGLIGSKLVRKLREHNPMFYQSINIHYSVMALSFPNGSLGTRAP
jgi:uncharacterized protein YbjT (DUF2867 family)